MEYKFYNREVELKELLDSFKQKVISENSILGYVVHGKTKIGKTRLLMEFIKKLEYDIELHSDIPKFEIEKHVIQYVCQKENTGPYYPFIRITNEIKNRNKLLNILLKVGQLGLAVVGINDALTALNNLVNAIDKGKDEKIIIKKETSTFNKYRKFIKRMGKGTPLIIYIQHGQWLDVESLKLIRKLAYDKDPMKGMIIIETDDNDINEATQNKINQLVYDGIFNRIHLSALDKHFPNSLLSSRFGDSFFTSEENEILYTVSAGCPGVLIDNIESYIANKWIYSEITNGKEVWQKHQEFKEKIKPPSQKLIDLIVSFYEDKQMSKSELVTIKKMSSLWNLSQEFVSSTISMIMDIMDAGYIILRDLDAGIISKNCFVIIDPNNIQYIAEYLHYSNNVDIESLKGRDIHHNNLLEAKEIKVCKSGILILWNYFEGKRARQVIIEAFEKHTLECVKKMQEITAGLVELHNNDIVHGFIKPESIIQDKYGKYQLATFDISLFSNLNLDESGYINVNYSSNEYEGNYLELDSLHYLSPERLSGDNPSYQSDIYSMGVVFYKTLTNRFPFSGRNKTEILRSIREDKVTFKGYLLSTISDDIKLIITKCISGDLNTRYTNAIELQKDLQNVEINAPKEKEDVKVSRTNKWKKYLTIGFFALITLLISFYFITTGVIISDPPPPTINISDCIAVSVNIEDNSSCVTNGLSSDLIEYLIIYDLMQSSNEKVLSTNGFNRVFANNKNEQFIPKINVTASIVNRSFSSEIRIQITNNISAEISKTRTYNVDFSTYAELLRGDIHDISKQILNNSRLAPSTFTLDWDAFIAFYNGEKAWNKLNMNAALHEYQKAIAIDHNFILAKLRLADVYRFRGNTTKAIELITEINPYLSELCQVDSLRAMALKNRMDGNIIEAKNNYDDIINIVPSRKEAYYDLAEAYFELRDIENAKINYRRALVIDSNFTQAINHYAYCFSHQGNHDKAMANFSKYLKLDSSANAFDSYGDGLMAAGLLDSAEWAKKQGLKLDNNLDYLYNSLNYIQLRKGEYKSAENNVNKFLKLQKASELKAEAYTNKALIYFAQGNLQMSLDTLMKAKQTFDTLDLVSRNHKMHWLLGQLYLLTEDFTKANEEIHQMKSIVNKYDINKFNYNEIYKYYLHLIFLQNSSLGYINKLDSIADIFNGELHDKIKDWSSPFDIAYFNTDFGKILYELGEYDHAELSLMKALIYNPNYALAHYYLSLIYSKTGKNDLKINHSKKFNELWARADQKAKKQFLIN